MHLFSSASGISDACLFWLYSLLIVHSAKFMQHFRKLNGGVLGMNVCAYWGMIIKSSWFYWQTQMKWCHLSPPNWLHHSSSLLCPRDTLSEMIVHLQDYYQHYYCQIQMLCLLLFVLRVRFSGLRVATFSEWTDRYAFLPVACNLQNRQEMPAQTPRRRLT